MESSVTAIYDRASYDREKREALARWGGEIDRIVSNQAENGGRIVAAIGV